MIIEHVTPLSKSAQQTTPLPTSFADRCATWVPDHQLRSTRFLAQMLWLWQSHLQTRNPTRSIMRTVDKHWTAKRTTNHTHQDLPPDGFFDVFGHPESPIDTSWRSRQICLGLPLIFESWLVPVRLEAQLTTGTGTDRFLIAGDWNPHENTSTSHTRFIMVAWIRDSTVSFYQPTMPYKSHMFRVEVYQETKHVDGCSRKITASKSHDQQSASVWQSSTVLLYFFWKTLELVWGFQNMERRRSSRNLNV